MINEINNINKEMNLLIFNRSIFNNNNNNDIDIQNEIHLNNYNNNENISESFNKSLINSIISHQFSYLDDYNNSIFNHFYHLYSDNNYSNTSYFRHKPKCVRQDTLTSLCFIDKCARNHLDSQLNYHKTFPDVLNNETNESTTSTLPKLWIKNRISSLNFYSYSHIFYRSSSIRLLSGSKSTVCLVSYKYKFVFMHVLKSGGTSMSGFLNYALCQSLNSKDCKSEIFDKKSCKKIKKENPNFFYFSFVRNPFDRAFSLFSHSFTRKVERKTENKNGKGKGIGIVNRIHNKHIKRFYNTNHTTTVPNDTKLELTDYSRKEILIEFGKFVYNRRFFGSEKGKVVRKKRGGLSTDHYYEQTWWIFNSLTGCPVVDWIGHLEHIEYDIEYLINLLNNKIISNYYINNGEYWKINTYGTTLKNIIYNNTKNDGLNINNLTDIYKISNNLTKINIKKLIIQLYQTDFNFLGYDKNKIE